MAVGFSDFEKMLSRKFEGSFYGFNLTHTRHVVWANDLGELAHCVKCFDHHLVVHVKLACLFVKPRESPRDSRIETILNGKLPTHCIKWIKTNLLQVAFFPFMSETTTVTW